MTNDYEDVCSICHRTERVAGKMLKMGDTMCICMGCLQKSTDMLNQSPYKDMLGMDPAQLSGMFPGMGMSTSPSPESAAPTTVEGESK